MTIGQWVQILIGVLGLGLMTAFFQTGRKNPYVFRAGLICCAISIGMTSFVN